jgi:hypothetical protein
LPSLRVATAALSLPLVLCSAICSSVRVCV